MKLTPSSEAYQKLVFFQQGQNTEERPKGLSYPTGSAPQKNLVFLKGFGCFLDKLHLPLTLFIALGKPLVLRSSALHLPLWSLNASAGATGNHDSGGQICSAVETETALAKRFRGIFPFALSANVDSGQLPPLSYKMTVKYALLTVSN